MRENEGETLITAGIGCEVVCKRFLLQGRVFSEVQVTNDQYFQEFNMVYNTQYNSTSHLARLRFKGWSFHTISKDLITLHIPIFAWPIQMVKMKNKFACRSRTNNKYIILSCSYISVYSIQ